MRKGFKFILPFMPALLLFGPIFMVIGHPIGHIGALMTGVGSAILLLKIVDQSKQIEELSQQLREKNTVG